MHGGGGADQLHIGHPACLTVGTPISTGVLRALQRLYQLGASGAVGVERLDDASPISLVHDVRRHAELGLSVGTDGGFYAIVEKITHAGATTERSSIDPYAVVAAGLPDIDLADYDLWLSRVTARESVAAMGSLSIGYEFPSVFPGTIGAGTTRPYLPIALFLDYTIFQAAAGEIYVLSLADVRQERMDWNLPIRLQRNGLLSHRSVATMATEVDLTYHLFIAPRQSDPIRGL